MPREFLHEELYRGAEQVARLAQPQLVLCGAGALGSHLADNLVRQGFRKLRAIDRDRVESHNVGTQLYGLHDVGGWKAEILRNRLFRSSAVEIEAVSKEIDERTVRPLLKGADLVIDVLDNSAARALVQRHCRTAGLACLHVGLNADYAEVIWDEQYRVPQDTDIDVCDYPLARNLVILAVAIASETIVRHFLDGVKESRAATLRDFAVRELEAPRLN